MKDFTLKELNISVNSFLIGAGDRTRTYDPIITNDVLYQLSYTGVRACVYNGIVDGAREVLREISRLAHHSVITKKDNRFLDRRLRLYRVAFRIFRCGGQRFLLRPDKRGEMMRGPEVMRRAGRCTANSDPREDRNGTFERIQFPDMDRRA